MDIYFGIYVDGTDRPFTYKGDESYKVGERVKVLFRGRYKSGIILYREEKREYTFKVLPIISKMEKEITVPFNLMKIFYWMRDYYLVSLPKLVETFLPSNLKVNYEELGYLSKDFKVENDLDEELENYFFDKKWVGIQTLYKKFGKETIKELINSGELIKEKTKLSRGGTLKGHHELLSYFLEREKVTKDNLGKHFTKEKVEKLVKNGKVIIEKKIKGRDHSNLEVANKKEELEVEVDLNEEQKVVRDGIVSSEKRYSLIYGITGSGKTEVYISLIKEGLKRGKGSIFLVPEISITPQMVERFKRAFGDEVAILHSKLKGSDREREWMDLYHGRKKVLLGVRSAIFAPVKDLGYIIIDEEHETTYKQDTTPIYSAKYVGIKRGEVEDAKVVLGSATPSIESYFYGREGVFVTYYLKKRYGGATLPKIEVVDMKEEGENLFSKKLLDEIVKRLRKNEQVILFLNRKGHSTYIQCNSCGEVKECPNCSISLNYYSVDRSYRCNYCGYRVSKIKNCSSCGSEDINYLGRGTEKIEGELEKLFPGEVLRVDSESSKEREFYEKAYRAFGRKEYRIIIGTQIISKGLHFPDVTLVGVLNADTSLNFPDFRAGEKTFQLVNQVSGRAGRGVKEGSVIIQTYNPENKIIKRIVEGDYEKFYEDEIVMRSELLYPPFARTINIVISSTDERLVYEVAKKYGKLVEGIKEKVEVYGPIKAPLYRIKGRYRYQFFIKGRRRDINEIKPLLQESKVKIQDANDKYRIIIDVDPINLM